METRYKYVYDVWMQKSFSKAAEKNYVSQPSLSSMVKKVETELGTQIFDRTSNPITLTEAGEVFIEYLDRLKYSEQLLQENMWNLKGLKRGTIKVGACNLSFACFMPQIFRKMFELYPGIDIIPTESNSTQLREMLSSGDIDLYIDTKPFDDSYIDSYPIIDSKVLLAIPQGFNVNKGLEKYARTPNDIKEGDYPAESLPNDAIIKILNEPFIFLKPENGFAKLSTKLFSKYSVSPNVRLEFDQLETALLYVDAGIGCSIFMDLQFKYGKNYENINLYSIDDVFKDSNFIIATKKGKPITPAIRAFIEIVQKEL